MKVVVLLVAAMFATPVVATPANDAVSSGALLWIRDGRLTPAALAVLGEMREAEKYGLRAGDYGAASLLARGAQLAPDQMATLDSGISAAIALFVTQLHS